MLIKSSIKLETFFTPGLYLPGCEHLFLRFSASSNVSFCPLSYNPSSKAANNVILSFMYEKLSKFLMSLAFGSCFFTALFSEIELYEINFDCIVFIAPDQKQLLLVKRQL